MPCCLIPGRLGALTACRFLQYMSMGSEALLLKFDVSLVALHILSSHNIMTVSRREYSHICYRYSAVICEARCTSSQYCMDGLGDVLSN